MRLFIAIRFDERLKDLLYATLERLKKYAAQGNFTRRENLHLTLVFLGEVSPDRSGEIRAAMDRVTVCPFPLELRDIGRFRRDGGDIYWIGVEENAALTTLYDELYGALTQAGFRLEHRPFKPHLTLGREIRMAGGFDKAAFCREMPPMEMKTAKISLMKSERIDGKLIYTEVYGKLLK